MVARKRRKGTPAWVKNLEKKLLDPKVAEKVKQNILLHRTGRQIDVMISELADEMKTASPARKAEIRKQIGLLQKAKGIGTRAFYEKGKK